MEGNRRITMTADDRGAAVATNRHGVTLTVDPDGEHGFSPLELLLAALGSCGAVDVALLMRKQRDPVSSMRIAVDGDKEEHRMTWLRVAYELDGDHDPTKVDRALHQTSENLCSVSRTIRIGAPVEHRLA